MSHICKQDHLRMMEADPNAKSAMEFIHKHTREVAKRFPTPPPGLKWEISCAVEEKKDAWALTYTGRLVPIVATADD